MSATDPRNAPGFRRRLLAARLFVWLERSWPAVWPAVAVLGIFLAFSLAGFWYGMPRVPHALLLLAFLGALGLAAWRARDVLRFSDRLTGLARLERDSDAKHQPLRGLDDTLPEGVEDPLTRRLWAMHRERLVAGMARLRLRPPRSLLPVRDPWALRAVLVLALVVAVVDAQGNVAGRLRSAFAFARPVTAAASPVRVDLWVTPPPYTRRPPLASEQTRDQAALTVPAGSVALAQIHHQAAAAEDPDAAPPRLAYKGGSADFRALGGGSAEARTELIQNGRLSIRDAGGEELGSWQVTVMPDEPPTAAFAGNPQVTHRGVLKVAYETGDDYGVAEVALLMAPKGRDAETERLGLVKPANQPAKLGSSSFVDLTAHPLAGLPVTMRLEAVDGIGQKGQSATIEVVLPARDFKHPLARAIIEQRRELARDPGTAPDVAGRLAALAETDAARSLPISVPLSLRVAGARLSFDQGPEGRREVIDLLWELALFIEDGSLSVAERKLHDLQEQLQKALMEGAKDGELEKMMQELQQALDEFLDQLARQAQERAQQPGDQQQARPSPEQQQRMVERRDLQQMLDRAKEMLKNGSKDAAREMLAQLQQTLENLKAGTRQAQQPSQGEKAVSDLQKMIQLQQQLLDKSFKMDRQQQQQQGGNQQQQQRGRQQQQGQQQGRSGGRPQQGGEQQQGQQQQGEQGQQGQGGGDEMAQAQAEQEALRKALGELMRRLGDAGMEIPRSLGQAEMQMRDAKAALQNGEPGSAAEAQNQAVDAMQRGGQAMMEQLREQMAQQQGEGPGDQPMPRPGGRQGRDPLGRAQRNEGGFEDRGTQVPAQGDLGRARDVLEELYRRAADQRRPPAELEYYRRLLDRF